MNSSETGGVEISRRRQMLPVPLTDQEELDRHRILRELDAEAANIDAKLDAAKAAAKSAHSDLNVKRRPVYAEVTTRTRETPVDVVVEMHPTILNMVVERRLDTGEIILRRDMKEAERQVMLRLERRADEAEDDAAAAIPEADDLGDPPPWAGDDGEEDEVKQQGRDAFARGDAYNPYPAAADESARWQEGFDDAEAARHFAEGGDARKRGEQPPPGASDAWMQGYQRVSPMRVVTGGAAPEPDYTTVFAGLNREQMEASLEGLDRDELSERHLRLLGKAPKRGTRATTIANDIRDWWAQQQPRATQQERA
jgi:hypothetical protein